MGKEELIERIVNLRVQIAGLRLEEKALMARLDVMPSVRVNLVKPVKKHKKPRSYYHRQKMSAKMKQIWASRTPEQRKAWAAKVVANRLGKTTKG